MVAITSALAVTLVGGALFCPFPYLEMKAFIDLPFRFAADNFVSKAAADNGLSPRDKARPNSASTSRSVAVGIKSAPETPSKAPGFGVEAALENSSFGEAQPFQELPAFPHAATEG